jgi:hypothetical protein
VRDSILARGLADPFLISEGSATPGYAGVWTQHLPGRMMEFFVLEEHRGRASECFAAALDSTGASTVEAQTPHLLLPYRLLLERVSTPVVENLLFGEGSAVPSTRRDLVFRRRSQGDAGPEGDWVVECDGRVVGAGGLLHHYNPPYSDLFMEVIPETRGRGVGTFLVQELCRVGPHAHSEERSTVPLRPSPRSPLSGSLRSFPRPSAHTPG